MFLLTNVSPGAIDAFMDRYKTRIFQRWAVKENISDKILNKAIEEFVEGLYEAKLGKGLYKKRIPHKGKGQRGGARSILFYLTGKVLIFCIGYPKNVQEDLNKLQRKKREFLAREF
jgi:hypothetical protein